MAKKDYSEDLLIQAPTAELLEKQLGWETVFAQDDEDFGADSLLGRNDDTEAVLSRDVLAALQRLNPGLPPEAYSQAVTQALQDDITKTLIAHNEVQVTARRRTGKVSRCCRPIGGQTAAPDRLRQSRQQPLSGGARAMGTRPLVAAAAGRDRICKWPATGIYRAQTLRGAHRQRLQKELQRLPRHHSTLVPLERAGSDFQWPRCAVRVAHVLFNDTAAFRDLGFGSGRPNKPKGDAPASPVHPADLVVHLEESHDGLQNFGSARPGSLSLTGILRLLFDAEAEEIADSVATKDEEIDEGQLPGDEKSHQKKISEKVALTPAYSTLLSCRRRPDGDAAAGGNRFRVEASLGG